MFRCKQAGCNKVVRRVEDVRNCRQCQRAGVAQTIPTYHSNDDFLTPLVLGALIGNAFHSHADALPSETPFAGGGGESAGGGSSGSWDSPSSDSGGSSFDSSSSDSSSSDTSSPD